MEEGEKKKQAEKAKREQADKEERKQQQIVAEQEKRKKAEVEKRERDKNNEQPSSVRKTLPGGLKVEIYKQGQGQMARIGHTVKVQYEGRLAANGKRFDKGSISFKLGMGEVIRGWD